MKKAIKKMLAITLCFMLVWGSGLSAMASEIVDLQSDEIILNYEEDINECDEIEWTEVETRDVEIYVTDGYQPIVGVEVQFNGDIKITGDSGIVSFSGIETSNAAKEIYTSVLQFGAKTTEIIVEPNVEVGEDTKIEFVVSYWTSDIVSSTDLTLKEPRNAISAIEIDEDIRDNVNKWVLGEYSSEERYDHHMVECDGKIYVGPERRSKGNYFLVYDIDNNQWSKSSTHDENVFGRIEYDSFISYGDKIYCFGYDALFLYDTKSDAWVDLTTPSSIERNSFPVAIASDDAKIYVYPSYKQPLANTEDVMNIYDIELNCWSRGASMPIATYTHSTITDNNAQPLIYEDKIITLRFTHYTDEYTTNRLSEMLIYDITEDEWNIVEMPFNIIGGSRTLYNGKIYFIGGWSKPEGSGKTEYKDTVHIYDITDDSWDTGKKMPYARSEHTATLIEDKIYVVGGEVAQSKSTKSAAVYDIETDKWHHLNELSQYRTHHTTIAYDNKLYCHGTGAVFYYKGDPDPELTMSLQRMSMEIYTPGPLLRYAMQQMEDITLYPGMEFETLQTQLEMDYPEVEFELSDGTFFSSALTWKVADSGFNGNAVGTYTICADIDLSDRPDIAVPAESIVTVEVAVVPYIITSVDSLPDIEVAHGTTKEQLKAELEEEYPTAEVTLSNGSPERVSLNWNIEENSEPEYDGEVSGKYTIYGEIDLEGIEDIVNSEDIKAEVKVTVEKDPGYEIVSIEAEEISASQYLLLAPTDRVHPFNEEPDTVETPSKVWANLRNTNREQVTVKWDTSTYDPSLTELQTFTGTVIPDEDSEITNKDGVLAELKVNVSPAEYFAFEKEEKDFEIDVLKGTSVDEISKMLKEQDKSELALTVYDAVESHDRYIFCDIELKEEDNPEFDSMVPGEYELLASLPENIEPFDDDLPGPIYVTVNVLDTQEIVGVKTADYTAYQSVEPENFKDFPELFGEIPAFVIATLENGMEVPVNVDWIWDSYNKDAHEDTILGTLQVDNVAIKQPVSDDWYGNMLVKIKPVDYKVIERLNNNEYETFAGFTLPELNDMLDFTQSFTIQSVTEGIDITTLYENVTAVLEEEKNPQYDPEREDVYDMTATLGLPDNIAYNSEKGEDFSGIILIANEVQIEEIESVYAMVNEGTEFADITLKNTVMVKLENGQTRTLTVDWGQGVGYDPYPEELTDSTPAVRNVKGRFVDWPHFINCDRVKVDLFITVTRVFEIDEISIPITGTMDVNCGSSLEDIYNMLESHTAELTLKNRFGDTSTANITFELREEDNESFNTLIESDYILTGYIELPENIFNSRELEVEFDIRTMRYSVSSIAVTRLQNVISGTAFEDIGLSDQVEVKRNDGKMEMVATIWNDSTYNPTKIGSQVVKGTLNCPEHITNGNNRQPSAIVTIINPTVQILSMEQIVETPTLRTFAMVSPEPEIEGFKEIKYTAKVLHEDGSVTTETISTFVKTAE